MKRLPLSTILVGHCKEGQCLKYKLALIIALLTCITLAGIIVVQQVEFEKEREYNEWVLNKVDGSMEEDLHKIHRLKAMLVECGALESTNDFIDFGLD